MPRGAPGEPQSARAVLMVRPANFGFNPETAPTNAFQQHPGAAVEGPAHEAHLREFDALVLALRGAGVRVIVAEDTPAPRKPDAIFPNNWVSFHADGTVVLYPMLAPNRRPERRPELLEQVVREGGFGVARSIDLTRRESEGKYLEGTGSLVLDRRARIAYACLSPRTDLDVLGEFAQLLDYELVTFEAASGAQAIYHTNVMMAVGTSFSVICRSAIPDPGQRDAVTASLAATGHEVIEISLEQMCSFAGNLLELDAGDALCIALSTTAWTSLAVGQREALARHGRIVAADIPTIERLGGGGVRCMLAEIHLPPRA